MQKNVCKAAGMMLFNKGQRCCTHSMAFRCLLYMVHSTFQRHRLITALRNLLSMKFTYMYCDLIHLNHAEEHGAT